jgi:hypothetical protein
MHERAARLGALVSEEDGVGTAIAHLTRTRNQYRGTG